MPIIAQLRETLNAGKATRQSRASASQIWHAPWRRNEAARTYA
jgi:hypothetical protein